jgi:GNAT superfamily N-acetyltransferase
MTRIAVRRAQTGDLDVLVRHRRGMFEAMGVKDRPELAQGDVDYRRWAKRLMKRGELVGFVASAGGVAIASGCVWLQERQPRPGFAGGGVPYLLSMFTEPAWRGRGLATRIVKAAIAWCRAEGHGVMTLHASKMGRGVYEKLGFERTWEMRVRV